MAPLRVALILYFGSPLKRAPAFEDLRRQRIQEDARPAVPERLLTHTEEFLAVNRMHARTAGVMLSRILDRSCEQLDYKLERVAPDHPCPLTFAMDAEFLAAMVREVPGLEGTVKQLLMAQAWGVELPGEKDGPRFAGIPHRNFPFVLLGTAGSHRDNPWLWKTYGTHLAARIRETQSGFCEFTPGGLGRERLGFISPGGLFAMEVTETLAEERVPWTVMDGRHFMVPDRQGQPGSPRNPVFVAEKEGENLPPLVFTGQRAFGRRPYLEANGLQQVLAEKIIDRARQTGPLWENNHVVVVLDMRWFGVDPMWRGNGWVSPTSGATSINRLCDCLLMQTDLDGQAAVQLVSMPALEHAMRREEMRDVSEYERMLREAWGSREGESPLSQVMAGRLITSNVCLAYRGGSPDDDGATGFLVQSPDAGTIVHYDAHIRSLNTQIKILRRAFELIKLAGGIVPSQQETQLTGLVQILREMANWQFRDPLNRTRGFGVLGGAANDTTKALVEWLNSHHPEVLPAIRKKDLPLWIRREG